MQTLTKDLALFNMDTAFMQYLLKILESSS